MPAQATTPALIPAQSNKIFYIDRLRIILTILVVLHHSFITYGAAGGWYYTQKTTLIGALIPMTMFVSINQSFFMGFFFFLSAYFIPPSYDKKGAARFVTDRLIRLGMPLLFYSFILSPFLSYLIYYFAEGHHITYLQYLGSFESWVDFGVLWFAAALLLFTLIYVLWRRAAPNFKSRILQTPTTGKIILFAAAIAIISFFVRTIFPVGWILHPLGFQLGHFSQYIALFICGLLASKSNWLNTLSYKTGKQMAWLALLLFVFFPVFYIIKVRVNMPIEWYSGGFHWQALLYAVWEQVIGFSIIIALLSFGKKFGNKPSALTSKLSRYTFAVYIFHPLLIISLALAVRNWNMEPAVKLLVVAPLAVTGSFLLASVLVLIPGIKRII